MGPVDGSTCIITNDVFPRRIQILLSVLLLLYYWLVPIDLATNNNIKLGCVLIVNIMCKYLRRAPTECVILIGGGSGVNNASFI